MALPLSVRNCAQSGCTDCWHFSKQERETSLLLKSCNTYCFPADRRPCWICISPWRNTLSPCCPVRNSPADPAWAPLVAPWCCYTMLEFDRGFCSVPGTAEDSSVGVCSGFDPVSPRRAFFSHGRYPQWHKWTKMSWESHSWGAGQTVKPCPNASYCLHLVLYAAGRIE